MIASGKGHIMKTRGFTLIELMLYTSITAIILVVVSLFLSTVLEARIKNQAISEIEQQGSLIMEEISRKVRNSQNINSPSVGNSSSTLSLETSDSSKDPTIFSLAGSIMRIKEGASSPVSITSNRANVTDLTFTNVSRSGTPGSIKIEFTLNHKNPEGRGEYEFGQTFYRTASLR